MSDRAPPAPFLVALIVIVTVLGGAVAGAVVGDWTAGGRTGMLDGEARALLDELALASEGSDAGYDRSSFPHWIDADGDGCDTRAEVLKAESLSPPQVDPFGCVVVAGDWLSPFDGVTVTDPADLDIDHLVPLAEAWRSGAADWDGVRRRAFANDLDHPGALVAVTATVNRQKGDQDPAQWRPPQKDAWCTYAVDWITVKVRWGLTADEPEHTALTDMLGTC